jgi:predicted RNase H-like HicB family nuclease
MFIATFDDVCGTGNTLKEAFLKLKEYIECEVEDVDYYEATKIKVQMNLIKVKEN